MSRARPSRSAAARPGFVARPLRLQRQLRRAGKLRPAGAGASRASAAGRLRMQPRARLRHAAPPAPRTRRRPATRRAAAGSARAALVIAERRLAMPGKRLSVTRSRNRRRSAAPSSHSRSIAGVSHSTRTTRPSPACGEGLPSISTEPPRALAPGRDLMRPVRRGQRGGNLPADPLRGPRQLLAAAPRKPRPGESSEIASIRLVLPAPFGPKIATGRPSNPSSTARCERNCASRSRVSSTSVRPASASRHRPPSRRCLRASGSGLRRC